ncbi:Translation initiation factor 3 subunit b [Mortierella antarctica]|nr:Translation initiation factor 3 subunit b [Mortierella antarctica]
MAQIVQNLYRQAANSCSCCSLIPSSTLKYIVEEGDVHDDSRKVAQKTLESISAIREAFAARAAALEAPPVTAAGPHGHELFRLMFDAQKRRALPGVEMFTDPHGPGQNPDASARTVYEHFKMIFDFYRTEFGLSTPNPEGMDFVGSVHYDNDNGRTRGYDNAFWNGEQWAFGDGDYRIFGNFADKLDITAHEVTHAVTQFSANLEYRYQSGALNESMSDVFASMVKQYYAPGGRQKANDADWLIGEGIFLVPGARALRDMAHPGTAFDDPAIGKDPQVASMNDFRVLSYSKDAGGVHIYSGIPNRAFFLVATSIGEYSWDAAGKIWYASLRDDDLQEVESSNAFKPFAELTRKHALLLGGQTWEQAVSKAWREVGVLP